MNAVVQCREIFYKLGCSSKDYVEKWLSCADYKRFEKHQRK